MHQFKIKSEYQPTGDQPRAIEELAQSIRDGNRFQTLLGVTGSGKTFTVAHVIERLQRPALVIAPNKTLAAQLCSEFRSFFPDNRVEYFVSYYDYYQPEAYIPQSDTYIEKDSATNEEIERLRHASTQAVQNRRDTIIVASVSAIYGLGSPEEYRKEAVELEVGRTFEREELLHRLVEMQFTRNDMTLGRGTFRARGDALEIHPANEDITIHVDFFGDELERINVLNSLTGEVIDEPQRITVFPASHYVASPETLERALKQIERELIERIEYFRSDNKLIEAQRIEQRTRFDMEMIREVGFCSGIENYSRYLDGRAPGSRPYTLVDYFPKDFLLVLDESHQALPQVRGMYNGDRARKEVLVEYGFRLPSALDNRPLKWEEFEQLIPQAIFTSATPGPFEKEHSSRTVEQIIRPTGLIDPKVTVKPTRGQVDDLIGQIRDRVARSERVLVTTLTKRMAEDLTEYLEELNVKVHYLHSDIHTLERTEILRDLRLGVYDVVVGINLLREGLDLPEVSLVAILDADKEGFLRSETSLIQTIGRAARNVNGEVIMYADNLTGSMDRAISETNRRRQIQVDYNREHGITPATVIKAVRDVIESKKIADQRSHYKVKRDPETLNLDEVLSTLADLEKRMKQAAKSLDFEQAALIRDEMHDLRRFLPAEARR